MIKVNLLGEARREKAARRPLITLAGANVNNYIVLGFVIIAVAWIGVRYWRLSSQLASINEEIAQNQREYDRLKPIIEEVENFKKKNAELKHKIEVIEQLKANQFGPVRIMDEVSKALPDLVWLNRMELSGLTISVTGQALNENAVANFIANLASSPFFSEPTLRVMRQDQQGVFSFDLSCGFSPTPRTSAESSGR
ncbi:MAG: PilN domain-containing protein [Thermoanaerobaculum sp.]|nr:PilN domain-containing protein [Thermoanaerobaculum sp.]MDW7968714.1 PilN domain-containing protein [Thermoanaerobaculum sp.]